MKKAVTSSVFGLFLCLASCKDPSSVSTPSVDAAGASEPAATHAASAAPAPPARCTTDADCRTFSNYCQESPCACQVLGKADADPKCAATVSCYVNPCARKSAACQSGKCELVVN